MAAASRQGVSASVVVPVASPPGHHSGRDCPPGRSPQQACRSSKNPGAQRPLDPFSSLPSQSSYPPPWIRAAAVQHGEQTVPSRSCASRPRMRSLRPHFDGMEFYTAAINLGGVVSICSPPL